MTKFLKNLEKNKDISSFFTLKTKTKAEYFFEAKTREDLFLAKKYSLEHNLPMFFLAGGSNFAITKDFIPGMIVKNNYSKLKLIDEDADKVLLLVSSGYPVSKLVYESIENGWSGFAYHKGLPGTVGGAIYNNSKWTKPLSSFGDHLIEGYLIVEKGNEKKVNRDYFQFAYDFSILHTTKEILIEAVFKLKKQDPNKLKKQGDTALDYRRQTQPQGVSTSGCFFQNISEEDQKKFKLPSNSVGYILDKLNLKGLKVGDFMVSDIHANFIINKGEKTSKSEDLKKLIKIIKKRVKDKFGLELKEEVVII